MKFVIAPDKYKGSLTGIEFCNAVEEGIQKVFPKASIVKLPLADGGDGTIDALLYSLKGEKISVTVNNPVFKPVSATYLYVAATQTAIIEMAEASGLKLVKGTDVNCMHSSSKGTGELIMDALKKGAKNIILGIGGSATNDAGIGMATALGYRFLDKNGQELLPIGKNLQFIDKIDATQTSPLLNNINVQVACDVTNPLYGKNGAAFVYAKQKGASSEEIQLLDNGLALFSNILQKHFNIYCQEIPGAGAAGGLGAGAITFLKGELTSGIELIKNITQFDTIIHKADWIVTGEGQLDEQTLSGKTIQGVLTSASRQNIPVAAFCGSVALSISTQEQLGLRYVCSITKGITNLETAMKQSYQNLVFSTYNFCKILKTSA
ncbi:glycerate kinase [Flavicella sediminum]|uniref:glycerate kinase n=1 Tax=Flavicella sediminum TaxID=2585141 RepID=UPI0011240415|nr:glycerate kinase [Flavicella sediminum]